MLKFVESSNAFNMTELRHDGSFVYMYDWVLVACVVFSDVVRGMSATQSVKVWALHPLCLLEHIPVVVKLASECPRTFPRVLV